MTKKKPRKYSIEVAPAAQRTLKKMNKDLRKRIFKELLSLEENPRPNGVKKLCSKDNLYRTRIGDYRLVYQIQDHVLLVLLLKVGHRREIYQ